MKRVAMILALSAIGTLTACGSGSGTRDAADDGAEATPSPEEPVSILRQDIEQPEAPAPQLEPLNTTIGFPEGGSELDAKAIAALETVLASEQLATGAPIVLRAHSDAGGSDDANARASQARGLAVAGWLIDKGVSDDRIDVIVFGEQNPIQPNALPDGSPNEAGRAANRRVEIVISPPVAKGGSAAATPAPAASESAASGD
ncbi:OmpA family protein [Erythrobacter sp. JK5]|uniref:OmpA family protein n=1 Tax=Erythrobacter sp. JK5 TaxID=2829500 RepID=UPI001BABE0E3|nr:OmpA family protein [Erythrobacter sp. JK5]QUL37440.1 OmpA family protein [Erythrobacter sp. JK5]